MNALLQSINKELFRHELLEQTTVEELNQFVAKYPFAAAGHLLLAAQSGTGTEAVSRAGLYVHDPLVLNLMLKSSIKASESKIEIAPEPSTTEPIDSSAVTIASLPESDKNEPDQAAIIASDPSQDSEAENVEEGAPAFQLPSLKIPESTGAAGQELSFEPYHTVDYFASQGIRLKREDLENDQFGRQLRSFTDWLRSMKRIEPINAENQPASPSEDSIKRHAADSIEERDVETEAMAEVWLKQGKTARAVAIYKKLSLLNPSKSHYFAAKIEQLKDL